MYFHVYSFKLQIHAHIYRSFIRHHKMLGVRIAKRKTSLKSRAKANPCGTKLRARIFFGAGKFASQTYPAGELKSRGNPVRFPLQTSLSLRTTGNVASFLSTQSKKKHHPSGWCFLFGMSRAGLNSLPRPARSALNQEVRQGSCEWLCHSWDAGSESSLVTLFAFAVCEAYKQQNLWAVTKKKDTHMGVFLFWSSTFAMQKWSPAGG